jgi:hypothetical protein
LTFFLGYVFGRFSARGVQKHHKNIFTKGTCRKQNQNFDKNFDVSFSSTFFVLSPFRVFFSDGSLKEIVSKSFLQKIRPKIQNAKPTFSRFFVYHVFGRFSMRGGQKHDKKIWKNLNLTPVGTLVLFRTLTHPPTTGVPGFFFFCRPLELNNRLDAAPSAYNNPQRITGNWAQWAMRTIQRAPIYNC